MGHKITIYGLHRPLKLIVGADWDFGSDSSKSTIFDIHVAQAILFRFLTGAKTNNHWGRHIGDIQYGRHQGYSTNHVYLHRPNAFGFWQTCLHLCYETLKRVSNFSELA